MLEKSRLLREFLFIENPGSLLEFQFIKNSGSFMNPGSLRNTGFTRNLGTLGTSGTQNLPSYALHLYFTSLCIAPLFYIIMHYILAFKIWQPGGPDHPS